MYVHTIYLVWRISFQSSVLTTRLKSQVTFGKSLFNQSHTCMSKHCPDKDLRKNGGLVLRWGGVFLCVCWGTTVLGSLYFSFISHITWMTGTNWKHTQSRFCDQQSRFRELPYTQKRTKAAVRLSGISVINHIFANWYTEMTYIQYW